MNVVNAVVETSAMKHPNQWSVEAEISYEGINDALSLFKFH